jgi:transcriptional regulator with XRE-family HTH domain
MPNSSRSSCCVHRHFLGPPAYDGRALSACRALFSVSADEVAALAGLSPYSLSRLERGHRMPAPNEVTRLLSAIGQLAERPSLEKRARAS